MARRRFLFSKILLSAAALAVLLFFARGFWLPVLGRLLIHDDGPAKAEIAVVLAGDPRGNRIVKAAGLVREGYVPAVLVSGPEGNYGFHESELAVQFALRRGYPKDWFIELPNQARSTKEEARVILGELQRRGIHSFLLVTSDYHTGRARRIYRATEQAMGGGPDFRMVAAPDFDFQSASWWHSRDAQKVFFMEWCKTIATAIGM